MWWWSSMLDVDFYRLYNGLRARDIMPCPCRVFAMIFAIFTTVCHVFKTIFLPWFSTAPINLLKYSGVIILWECASSLSSCSWTCSCWGVLNASINACCFSSISNRVRLSSSSSCLASSSFAAVSAALRSSSSWASAASRSYTQSHTRNNNLHTLKL